MKVLIIDDHPLFLEGMKYLVEQLDTVDEVQCARNGQQAAATVEADPDFQLILVDLKLPGEDGFATMATLAELAPPTAIAILSASEDRTDMERALNQGARGYIPKSTEPNVILHALRLILDGGIYVPPNLITGLPCTAEEPTANPTEGYVLSPRQQTILRYLSEGRSNKFIAYELNLTETTVKGHITSILRSLKVSNRTQAALLAQRKGLIDAREA